MTVLGKEVPANFVPAAAVIRGGLALLALTGRKGFVGGFWWYLVKYQSSTLGLNYLNTQTRVQERCVVLS